MEIIRQAIERARADETSSKAEVVRNVGLPRQRVSPSPVVENTIKSSLDEIEISSKALSSRRIVTHDSSDQRSRPYDILRTQVLQSMARNGWRILGITSPSPGCGKTLTAINLALSIARQPEQSVIVVDMDLQRPQLANYLGLTPEADGVLALLSEHATLPEVTLPIRTGGLRITVLPTASTAHSSELMSSRTAQKLLQSLRQNFQTIIIDLPPMLSSDDVLAVLPHLDCILLVAAVGLSTASEVQECARHLHAAELIRLVVNKATDETFNSYHYSSRRPGPP